MPAAQFQEQPADDSAAIIQHLQTVAVQAAGPMQFSPECQEYVFQRIEESVNVRWFIWPHKNNLFKQAMPWRNSQ